MSLQNKINEAVKFVDNSKKYSIACKIIDELIKELIVFIKDVELKQSKLELNVFQNAIDKKEIKRLKTIIKLYNGNSDLSQKDADILLSLKNEQEYYQPMAENFTILEYHVLDAILKVKQPNYKSRPQTIEQLKKGYEILTKQNATT